MIKGKRGRFDSAVAVLFLAMLATPLWVHADDALEARLKNCRTLDDSARRLACLDAIELPTSTSTSTSIPPPPPTVATIPVPTPGPAPSPAPAETPPAAASTPMPPVATASPAPAKPANTPAAGPRDGSFGSETVQVKTAEEPKSLKAKVLGSFDGVSKGLQITLDNGQVWLCVDDRSYDYTATNPGASIERNFAGNYWMKLTDSSFRFRVRRIK